MKGFSAFIYREWMLFAKSPLDIGFSLLPALISLLFFSLNMAGVVGDIDGIPYTHFLVPGLAIMALTSNTIGAASRTFNEGYSSILLDLLSYPTSPKAYVNAKLFMATIIAGCQGIVFLFIGSLIFSMGAGWLAMIQSIVVLLVTALGIVGFSMCFALIIKDMGTFLVVSNVIGQVLIWTSTVFYPSDRMPLILRWLGLINPLSHGTDLLRAIWFENTQVVFMHWFYLSVFAIICSVLASTLLTKRTDKFIY